MNPIDRCAACWDMARQAAAIANNQIKLVDTLGADYLPEDGSSASREMHVIAQKLLAHGHREARLVTGLAVLLAEDLRKQATRDMVAGTHDELRVAIGLPILLPHPVPRASNPGDDERSVA